MATTLTTKSQVTLPKPIRDYLKVAPGDQVDFQIMADGSVSVVPVRTPYRDDEIDPALLAHFRSLSGSAPTDMTADEWMKLLRGYDEDDDDPGFASQPVPRKSR